MEFSFLYPFSEEATVRFRYLTRAAVGILLLLGCAGAAAAQESYQKITVNGGFGVTPLAGQITDRLNTGWHFTVGAGYRFTQHFDMGLRYSFNSLGVKNTLLAEAAVPSGNANVWSITADPRLRFLTDRSISPYVVGDVGYFRRTINFTQPTLQSVLLFDPFLGFFFPTLVPVDVLLGSIVRGGVGGGAGIGFDIKFGSSRLRLFTEARYEYGSTSTIPTRMVPVTLGIRW